MMPLYSVGIPDSDLPLFDYEYIDYSNIGGVSEFPLIDSVSFCCFVICMYFTDNYTFYLQYPWMVSFGEYDNQTLTWNHYCGGAIISKFVIVTASHCFYGKDHFNAYTQILTRLK